MSDAPYTPPAPNAQEAQQLNELKNLIGEGFHGKIDAKSQEAIMTVAKDAPDHAGDILRSFKSLRQDAMSWSHLGTPSKEAVDDTVKTMTRAAADYSNRSNGQDGEVIDAMYTLAAFGGQKITKEKLAEDLHKFADARKNNQQVQVDTSSASDTDENKQKREAAQNNEIASQKDVFGDMMAGFLKMIITALAGWLGIDLGKLGFGGDDKQAPAEDPATLKKLEAEGKSPIIFFNDKGEKRSYTATMIDTFLEVNGVQVPAGENKTEAMWIAVDKLRKENGLESRAGQRDLNAEDVKMLDKIHDAHFNKAKEVSTSLNEEQKRTLVAEVTHHPELAKDVDMQAAFAQFQKSANIKELEKDKPLNETIKTMVAVYARDNGIDIEKVSKHLDDDHARIVANATPAVPNEGRTGAAKS